MVTGSDLIQEQMRVAAGRRSRSRDDLQLDGHAIECRINAGTLTASLSQQPGPWTCTCLRRPVDARRLPLLPGLDDRPVRLADREADRLGPRPRGGDRSHGPRAGGVSDRGPGGEDDDPLHRRVLASGGSDPETSRPISSSSSSPRRRAPRRSRPSWSPSWPTFLLLPATPRPRAGRRQPLHCRASS